ncbi:MAG TPA: ATP-dependent DNA helicase [Blastocatellia bacterium]|nr:ATP-dependent DNA helicase [Blastocatellia bacterium]
MEEIFGRNGLFARHHPEYEYRPGQVAMAEAIATALVKHQHLLVEAGTGTGKTLAYLVPAVATGNRVIISTGTKNLQEQLFYKDIPFLQSVLPRKFKATYLKGRSNYVCLHRLKRAESMPVLEGMDEMEHFRLINRWARESPTGDRAELSELPENLPFWRHIDARSDICIGQKCPSFEDCFITKARQSALESEIIIVNHHLFFADLALRDKEWGQVLPDYSAVIFDEAHQIEDVAMQYFGAQVSSYQVDDLLGDISRLMISDVEAARELTKASARVARMADQFWMNFTGGDSRSSITTLSGEGRFVLRREMFMREKRDGTVDALPAGERYVNLKTALTRLIGALQVVKDAPPEMEAILRRVEQVRFDLDFVVLGAEPTFVYWAERRGRGVYLQATPIDASGILNDRLFSSLETVVLTSATLTSGGSFDFIRARLGIGEAAELVAESNYDYEQQALLYLPPKMPDPRDGSFAEAAAAEIVKVLKASRGRAFVLCTSNSQMQVLRVLVEDEIDFPVLMQGEGSRSGILERFRETPHAVLFATASFWQGVDVRGDALSCVIIDKLPFAVPSDPVVAARQRYIDNSGGNSFGQYSVPSAIITLKQGLGRLIRSATDRGVLSILDPRIVTKNYGQSFLKSLPPCRITRKIEEVERFFDEDARGDLG